MKTIIKSFKFLLSKFPWLLVEEIISIALSVVTVLLPINIAKDIVKSFEDGVELKNVIIKLVISFLIISAIEVDGKLRYGA